MTCRSWANYQSKWVVQCLILDHRHAWCLLRFCSFGCPMSLPHTVIIHITQLPQMRRDTLLCRSLEASQFLFFRCQTTLDWYQMGNLHCLWMILAWLSSVNFQLTNFQSFLYRPDCRHLPKYTSSKSLALSLTINRMQSTWVGSIGHLDWIPSCSRCKFCCKSPS